MPSFAFVIVKFSLHDYNYDYDYLRIFFIRLRLRLRNRLCNQRGNRLYNRLDYTSLPVMPTDKRGRGITFPRTNSIDFGSFKLITRFYILKRKEILETKTIGLQ